MENNPLPWLLQLKLTAACQPAAGVGTSPVSPGSQKSLTFAVKKLPPWNGNVWEQKEAALWLWVLGRQLLLWCSVLKELLGSPKELPLVSPNLSP